MPIPDYQTLMLPLLRWLADGNERSFSEAVEAISDEFDLSPEERKELLPSGTSTIIRNRVGWARTYLKHAGLVVAVRRGVFKISDRGKSVLQQQPQRIDVKFLEQFPEFVDFRSRRKPSAPEERTKEAGAEETPDEALEAAYSRLRSDLEGDLLEQVQNSSSEFFERLVVELLVKMGYGGSRRDAGQAIGRSGDGGIDGIIKEDRLGLDIIYIQAKRWEGTVGRPEIQKFAGALQGYRARKGVFITSSTFSREAEEYAAKIENKIVLIDGATLAGLMIDHDVGVSTAGTYQVKRIDSDYFSEE